MRIPLALFADHAIAHQTDGKLYVTGGGIRALRFPSFPATQPHLALALGIELEPAELGSEHTLSIEASGPTTLPIFRPVRVTFTVPPQEDPTAPGYIHFVSNMDNVSFPLEGDYAFVIAIDGQHLEQVRVRVERGGNVSEEVEANALLMDGYRAFNQGDSAAAEAIFRDVVARFPKVAGGHNNLGFVLLAKGDAPVALEAFAKAQEIGYPQNEISDANVACALYVAGDAASAIRIFTDCLRTHIFRTPATLFGIGASGLFPVQVNSAAEYVSLMALNAAWSALGTGDMTAVAHYLGAARAADLSLRGDSGAQLFVQSVRALEAKTG